MRKVIEKKICDLCGAEIFEDPLIMTGCFSTRITEVKIRFWLPKHEMTRSKEYDLCPTCEEKLYKWIKEQKEATGEVTI